jgi:TRAP-type C4-dicarboxylate transport system permease small subunit
MRWAANWAGRIERTIDVLIALMLGVMTLTVFYQVFGRYVIGRAPAWSEELARFLLLFVVLLGTVSALRSGSHISVTMLFDGASAGTKHVLFWLRDLALGAVLAMVAWQGALFAQINGAQASPAFEIPMAVPYASLPLAAALMLVQLVLSRLAGRPVPVSSGEGDTMITDPAP